MKSIQVGRYTIAISHPEKEYFPEQHITKGEIVAYYNDISSHMLPLVKNHPIAMLRYPNGITAEGFYQKDAGDYFPAWVKRIAVATQDDAKTVHYVVVNNVATLVYLANQGCITPHMWLSRADKLHYPDRLIFDLDPVSVNFKPVVKAAFVIKALLEQLGLVPYVLLTGSKGAHVVVPLKRVHTFETVRAFAYDVAQLVVRYDPNLFTTTVRKDARGKKLFVDYMRNAFSATAVVPYAVRPHPHAPVATPIAWDELEDIKLVSARYTIKTVFSKMKRDGDPWHDFTTRVCVLSRAIKKISMVQ